VVLDQAWENLYSNRVIARLSKLPWPEIGILILAAVLRLIYLDVKPPHFDEGVNGWFVDQMTEHGYYHYDPSNYHGPLHFYLLFFSQTLFGRNLWALRLPAVLASLLAIWMVLKYREFFGRKAAFIAGLAMAISPAFVFYGRYSIHEGWQVLFSAGLLWGIIGLWTKGERRFLNAVVISTAGMILTKETYILHIGCAALAGGVLWLLHQMLPSQPATPWAKQSWKGTDLAWVSGWSLFAIVFFYSGNFMDFPGLSGLYETFAAWFQTGVKAGGHEKDMTLFGVDSLNYYWLYLMARYEWPGLLGVAACLRYVFPSRAPVRYLEIYACGVVAAYSIIPYKTPWCIISMLWPFYLVLGALAEELMSRMPRAASWVVALLLAIPFAASFRSSLELNFKRFDDDSEPYVYVQTYRESKELTDPLLGLAAKDPAYYGLEGHLYLGSYYPLPWMLGEFTSLSYYQSDGSPKDFADFIVIDQSREEEFEKTMTEPYYKRRFRLRSGEVPCTVYFREEPFRQWFNSEPEIQP
jgi:uncharacterized protein (TIGR03663 family)